MGVVMALEGTLLLLTCFWLLLGYSLQKSRYEKLQRSIASLDQKYILGEVIPKPKNETESLYYEIMKTVSRSAIDEVEKEKGQREEYQTYVESWIHEIKTPLTACSLILENGGESGKLQRELKKADNLIESILYYARSKQAQKDLLIRPFHIMEVADECIKDEMPLLIAAGVSIEKTGDFEVYSDEKAIGFILKQLLCNSAKYCPHCHIKIDARQGSLIFEDNGIGIPSYELPRVTEKGFTGTNGRKLGNSTGMGLYLVKVLCDHLSIRFSADSKVNEYTRFVLAFDSLTKM